MDGGILYNLFTTPLGFYFFESCMKRSSKYQVQYLYADSPPTTSEPHVELTEVASFEAEERLEVEDESLSPSKHESLENSELKNSDTSPISSQIIATIIPYGGDNYSYCFHGDSTDIFFDFGDAAIANHVKTAGRKMVIFLTHYHHDHTAGIYNFKNKATIYGTQKSQYKDHLVQDGEVLKIDHFEILCIHTPCHSRDHVCYRVFDTSTNKKFLVSGDCVFLAGTGKFFEGNGSEMVDCITKLLRVCDGDEILLGGHEYSEHNLLFSQYIEPENTFALEKFKWCQERGLEEKCTYGHSNLLDETKYNVFFRWREENIRAKAGTDDPGKILEWLRHEKSSFDSKYH